ALSAIAAALLLSSAAHAQRYTGPDGKLRVALAQHALSPNGTWPGPKTILNGGIQQQLAGLGASVRIQEAALTADENTEYGGWKRLRMGPGPFPHFVAPHRADGTFTGGGC